LPIPRHPPGATPHEGLYRRTHPSLHPSLTPLGAASSQHAAEELLLSAGCLLWTPHSLLEHLHHGSPPRITAGLLKLRLLTSKSLRIRRNSPRVDARRQSLLLLLHRTPQLTPPQHRSQLSIRHEISPTVSSAGYNTHPDRGCRALP
jgi:hypothetical protein